MKLPFVFEKKPPAPVPLRDYFDGGRFQPMSQKELVLEAIQELPDDSSIDQIADRVEFLAALQKGINDLDRGETIPHETIKKQMAAWLTE
jgi:hypothetical protein